MCLSIHYSGSFTPVDFICILSTCQGCESMLISNPSASTLRLEIRIMNRFVRLIKLIPANSTTM